MTRVLITGMNDGIVRGTDPWGADVSLVGGK
jgi:hypothetical protein